MILILLIACDHKRPHVAYLRATLNHRSSLFIFNLRARRLVLTPLHRRFATVVVCGTCAAALGVSPPDRARVAAQTFVSAVDVIAVDAQVWDQTGRALPTLGPADFEVTIDGRPRQVVSAVFTQYDLGTLPGERPDAVAMDVFAPFVRTLPGRTFIIAIDTASFSDLDVRVATLAAERFTWRVRPDDEVGLIVLPGTLRVAPSTRHAAVRQALLNVVGRKSTSGDLEMGVEEIIDITAAMANQSTMQSRQTIGRIVSTADADLGVADSLPCAGTLRACTEQAMNEAMGMAMSLEEDVSQSIAGLDRLMRELRTTPGRKTVLLLSGGMPVSDRSGGRPALTDNVKGLGEQAAYANATINTVYFDASVNGPFTAASRRRDGTSGRTRDIYTRALAEFSEPSGGTLLLATTGAGESEIDQVVTQVSSYYVLGVTPDTRDYDGRPHRLKVRVKQRDADVHHRQLVVMPRR
jgi:VWFA-related protein